MAIPVYLWLMDDAGKQVKGSVDINDRESSIEIVELMHAIELPTDEATGKITAKPVHGDYAIIKEVDSASSLLYQGVTTGKRYQKAVLRFYKINDNGIEVEYFRTTLEEVRINRIEPFMFDIRDTAFGNRNHLEALYLRYEKITWHYIDGNIIYSDSWNERRSF